MVSNFGGSKMDPSQLIFPTSIGQPAMICSISTSTESTFGNPRGARTVIMSSLNTGRQMSPGSAELHHRVPGRASACDPGATSFMC